MTGSSSRTRSCPLATRPFADRRAVDLIDRDARRNREHDFARHALQHFDAHGAGDLRDVLAESDHRGDARARAQRQLGAAVVDLAFPRQRERLIGPAERRPPAFARRFRALGDEAAGDGEIDAAARQRQDGA